MLDDMGTFRIDVEIENPAQPEVRRAFDKVLVDTDAELSWFPAAALEALGIARRKQLQFRHADGSVLTRWTGSAVIHAAAMA